MDFKITVSDTGYAALKEASVDTIFPGKGTIEEILQMEVDKFIAIYESRYKTNPAIYQQQIDVLEVLKAEAEGKVNTK